MTFSRRKFLAGTGAMFWAAPLWANANDLLQIEGPAFGAHWRIRVAAGRAPNPIVSAITDVIASVNAQMSPFDPNSEISRLNRMKSLEWVPLSTQTHATFSEAKRVATLTQGAFDPTLGGITGRYGFGPILRAPAGTFEGFELGALRAKKAHIHQTFDLCGIAKGHALDRIATALNSLGLDSFFVELGGEVYAQGEPPGGRVWTAGLEHPMAQSAALHRRVKLKGEALATSGNRINSFEYGGRRYGHIIDPKHHEPADTSLASVSVFAPQAITADALATSLFAMGAKKGIAFATRENIPALFLRHGANGLQETVTSDFATRIIG